MALPTRPREEWAEPIPLRADNPLFPHVLFPTYVAALIWGGLYLRDARVRALLRSAR